MHHRPLALVSVLAGGDYLLWNWSLQGSHDVLALASGLTLPPLTLALIWLLALNAARLLAHIARSPQQQHRQRQRRQRQRRRMSRSQQLTQHHQHPGGEQPQEASSSSKLAA